MSNQDFVLETEIFEFKRYCSKCGEALIFYKKYIIDYDSNTGDPVYWCSYKCPNKRWFHIFTEHDDVDYSFEYILDAKNYEK